MEKLIKYSGILTSFMILCGVIKFYVYYKGFNISIVQFLDIGEVVTLFMDNLIGYFSIIAPVLFFSFVFYTFLREKIRDSSVSLRSIFSSQKWLICLFVILCFVGSIVYYFMNEGVTKLDLLFIAILILCLFTLFPLILVFSLRILKVSYIDLNLLILSATLILFTLLTAKNEIYKVKKGHYSGVKISILNEPNIISDKNVYFIGLTKNYLFIHNDTLNITKVYPIIQMNTITFPKLEKK